MLTHNTPIVFAPEFGLWVKREDLSCSPPGPQFSKTRGVFAHIASRPERRIGVLDTYHSQAGHAVAEACAILGKSCTNFYPNFKYEPGPRSPQLHAEALGARLVPLQAGRSSVLYHQAKKLLEPGSYLMPNALKLPEMITETAEEVRKTLTTNTLREGLPVLIAASSGTIAAGVLRGFMEAGQFFSRSFIIHMGYDRSGTKLLSYIHEQSGIELPVLVPQLQIVNEGYAYKDIAEAGPDPTWPCNPYYDLKAFRWWMAKGRQEHDQALLWNIG